MEITARVEITPASHFVWSNELGFAADCLVCQRVGRVVRLRHGLPYGVCGGDEHRAPLRVSAFDTTDAGTERRLRCRVTSWWAPFADREQPDVQASELTAEPWVELNYRVGCHTCRDGSVGDWLSTEGRLRSGTGTVTTSCERCGTELLTAHAPEINLVS